MRHAGPDTFTLVAPVRFVPVSVTVTLVPRCAVVDDAGLIPVSVGAGGAAAVPLRMPVLLVPPVTVAVIVPAFEERRARRA